MKNTMNMIVKKKTTMNFFLIEQSLVVHVCDLSPSDVWARGWSWVSGQPSLYSKFLTSLGYRVRLYLKMITTATTNGVYVRVHGK